MKFYQQQFGPERLTLTFAGDFDPHWLRDALAARFASWQAAASALQALPSPARVRGRRVLLIDAPGAAQTYFWIANVGVGRHYAQRAALDVTNTAFGGSFGSMLNQALRVRSGLTYSIGSGFRRGSVPGEFGISSFLTQTASTAQALQITLQTLASLKRDGVSEAGIESARSYLLGQYPMAFETSGDWAGALADLDLFQLPDSYIEDYGAQLRQVNSGNSMQVVRTAFPSVEDIDIVLIGDADRIRTQAADFGPVMEKSLEARIFCHRPPNRHSTKCAQPGAHCGALRGAIGRSSCLRCPATPLPRRAFPAQRAVAMGKAAEARDDVAVFDRGVQARLEDRCRSAGASSSSRRKAATDSSWTSRLSACISGM